MQASNLLRKLFKRNVLSLTKVTRSAGMNATTANSNIGKSADGKEFESFARSTIGKEIHPSDVSFTDELSKHQTLLRLYDIAPVVKNSYVAPSATLVGEVYVHSYATVWNNVVVRGDINYVVIGTYSSIGDNTVIQTVASLPTGLPAT